MKVLLAGGGTGGHVYPAIAIANKIKEHNPDCEILFVGTKNGIESEIVPKAGFELKTGRLPHHHHPDLRNDQARPDHRSGYHVHRRRYGRSYHR